MCAVCLICFCLRLSIPCPGWSRPKSSQFFSQPDVSALLRRHFPEPNILCHRHVARARLLLARPQRRAPQRPRQGGRGRARRLQCRLRLRPAGAPPPRSALATPSPRSLAAGASPAPPIPSPPLTSPPLFLPARRATSPRPATLTPPTSSRAPPRARSTGGARRSSRTAAWACSPRRASWCRRASTRSSRRTVARPSSRSPRCRRPSGSS